MLWSFAGLLAACVAPVPPLHLPPEAATLADDPLEASIRGASDFFRRGHEGEPARAAMAVAQLEYMAVEIMAGRSRRDLGILVGPALSAARHDVRAVLGIPDAAAPQQVIDTMAALAADPAAPVAPQVAPEGGAVLWSRLGSLPRISQANTATEMTLRDWDFGPPQELPDVAWLRPPG